MYWTAISEHISQSINSQFSISNKRSISGGSINDAWLVEDRDRRYFVKINAEHLHDMFAAEAEGLTELNKPQAIKVPHAICWGSARGASYIVMDYIDEGGRGSQTVFGQQLATLHRHTSKQFGWHRDNTIGSTPQINTQSSNWVDFLRDKRLGYQLKLAQQNGYGGRLQSDGNRLLENLGVFFSDYSPSPSLLHGDLWSGNYFFDIEGNPVIFDPAVYYGDREADLAMTELFGGFSGEFYAAYDETYPIDVGYNIRKTLYNLYHILNHLNLFGSGYQGQAERMLSKLLAEL